MNILLVVYEFVLLGYTAWRTFDFLKTNIPTDFGEELALLGLFALDIGLILWHYYLRKHAKSEAQESTAKTMVVADFAGSFGSGVADMILRQTLVADYTVPPLLATVLIWGIPAIVALNVGGVLFVQYADPDEKEKRLKRIATYKATEKALDEVIENIDGLAMELSKDIAGDIRRRVRAAVSGKYYGSIKVKDVGDLALPPEIAVTRPPTPLATLKSGLGDRVRSLFGAKTVPVTPAALPASSDGAGPKPENPTPPGPV